MICLEMALAKAEREFCDIKISHVKEVDDAFIFYPVGKKEKVTPLVVYKKNGLLVNFDTYNNSVK